MKKLFVLMLILLLIMPAALAEAAPYTIDLGDFTMDVFPGDSMDLAEKADGAPMLYLFTADTGDANYTDNINLVWSSQDVSAMTQADLDELAEFVLTQSQEQYAAMGITADNFQLLGAELVEGEKGSILYSFDLDLAATGIDYKATIYQYQVFVMMGEKGSCIFTASSDSFDSLSAMSAYADTIQVK